MNEEKMSLTMVLRLLLVLSIWICEIAVQRGCLWAIYEPILPEELEVEAIHENE